MLEEVCLHFKEKTTAPENKSPPDTRTHRDTHSPGSRGAARFEIRADIEPIDWLSGAGLPHLDRLPRLRHVCSLLQWFHIELSQADGCLAAF